MWHCCGSSAVAWSIVRDAGFENLHPVAAATFAITSSAGATIAHCCP
jgi:hypothetical protein